MKAGCMLSHSQNKFTCMDCHRNSASTSDWRLSELKNISEKKLHTGRMLRHSQNDCTSMVVTTTASPFQIGGSVDKEISQKK